MQLLDDFKEKREYRKLKEEAVDRTLWRTGFEKSLWTCCRQTTKWMNLAWFRPWPSLSEVILPSLLRKGTEGKRVKTIYVTPQVNREKHGGTFNCVGLWRWYVTLWQSLLYLGFRSSFKLRIRKQNVSESGSTSVFRQGKCEWLSPQIGKLCHGGHILVENDIRTGCLCVRCPHLTHL